MNFTMYPSLLGKLLPAIWGYMLAEANDAQGPANFTVSMVSEPVVEWDEDAAEEAFATRNVSVSETEPTVATTDIPISEPRYYNNVFFTEMDNIDGHFEMDRYVDAPHDTSFDDYDDDDDPDVYDWIMAYDEDLLYNDWIPFTYNTFYGIDTSEDFMPGDNIEETASQMINRGIEANLKIRQQICGAGLIIMFVSSMMLLFFFFISICSRSRTRTIINESLKMPLLKLDALDKKVDECMAPPSAPFPAASANPQPASQVATGEVVVPRDEKGEPRESPENQYLSYV